jgi:hypothetical protein
MENSQILVKENKFQAMKREEVAVNLTIHLKQLDPQFRRERMHNESPICFSYIPSKPWCHPHQPKVYGFPFLFLFSP